MLNKTLETLKANKTIESLRSNKTVDKALQTLNMNKEKALESFKEFAKSDFIQGIREKSEALSHVTLAEKEKIVDKLVESLLKGQELGADPAEIRAKVKAKLFEHEKGDTLFINNLKYINQLLAASMPRSLAELSDLRETIAHKLVQDVQERQAKETAKRPEQKQTRTHEQSHQAKHSQHSQRPARLDKRMRGEKPQRAAATHQSGDEELSSGSTSPADHRGAAARSEHRTRHHSADPASNENESE